MLNLIQQQMKSKNKIDSAGKKAKGANKKKKEPTAYQKEREAEKNLPKSRKRKR